ncbi:N-acetylmuramate alpha-1-phosphate uridylyltransferase MurU [Marinicella sp. W31]|uniref:N-acetylmuramate alpha-1-phosphate uridylyltransferase MurU n=1 Tax=Marinicella sp. W31 TaxID=3023713 RepID=UPI003757CE79
MKAMILAAGRGQRLRPLTDTQPKPLVEVNNKPLLQRHIEKLLEAGFTDIVINVSWLRHKIIAFLKEHNNFNANIQISDEGDQALETGGGMFHALPLLGEQPFLVVNGDVYTDYRFDDLESLQAQDLVSLLLVNNPEHNPSGDFCVQSGRLFASEIQATTYTYSGIGIFHPQLFKNSQSGAYSVVPLIRQAIADKQAAASVYTGLWSDVGTQERLDALNQQK